MLEEVWGTKEIRWNMQRYSCITPRLAMSCPRLCACPDVSRRLGEWRAGWIKTQARGTAQMKRPTNNGPAQSFFLSGE